MPLVGFEPTISAGERPKTYALDRAATGTGLRNMDTVFNKLFRAKAASRGSILAPVVHTI